MTIKPLAPEKLYHRCDPEQFSFDTTDKMDNLTEFIGQPRAVDAVRFGVDIRHDGYNVFALGDPGTGKFSLIRELLRRRASDEPVSQDICYVYNFEEAQKPRLLMVPAGMSRGVSQDMDRFVEEARNALRTAFESEEYQNRQQSIDRDLQDHQQKAFAELQKTGAEYNLAPVRTPEGLVFAPARDGEVLPPDEFKKLSEEDKRRIEEKAGELQQEALKIFQKIPQWEREVGEKRRNLNRETALFTVGPIIGELLGKYAHVPDILSYLDAVEKDIVRNVRMFFQADDGPQKGEGASAPLPASASGPDGRKESLGLRRYRINIIVAHGDTKGAPVVYDQNPSYQNLVGRVEHLAHMGTLVTDFNMIRPGSLHKANGGYLILDILKLLQQPFAWEGLKQALKTREIRIEPMGQTQGYMSTVSLEPEAAPLKVKVILLGNPAHYYMMRQNDPEFGELFKVAADFDYRMDRTPENELAYARLIATMVCKEKLRPFDRTGVARIIEQGSRLVEDGQKLSALIRVINDLLKEADYWAGKNGSRTVGAVDVQKAVDMSIHRSDRIREAVQEQIQRDIVFIDSAGAAVGQINGLAVLQMGEFAFGRPSRITARIHLGKGDVVDIEREVAMGGAIHSKGVLILAGFLNGRFAMDQPLSLSASLVFEQSYSGVDGDSASSAELYALLSAIAEVPLKQAFAVTGSVNQHGFVQPIGGVNEKIEGFFDICRSRGLTGDQGVLIPISNVTHLMLRHDVVDAAREGKFHIYPVETVDQGIELLTGIPAGAPDVDGNYPTESVNGRVRARLMEMAEKRIAFGRKMQGEKKETA